MDRQEEIGQWFAIADDNLRSAVIRIANLKASYRFRGRGF
jgi:hypothetical protein